MVITEETKEQVRFFLRRDLTKVRRAKDSIRVMADERVPPGAGEEFMSIFGGSQSLAGPPHDVHKRYEVGFQIGITRRLEGVPHERAGESIITYNDAEIARVKPSMLARLNEIAEVLNHGDGWTLINAINAITFPANGGCFITPFALLSFSSEPEQVREEHFDIQPENTGLARDVRYVGLLYRMEFGGALYIRPSRPT